MVSMQARFAASFCAVEQEALGGLLERAQDGFAPAGAEQSDHGCQARGVTSEDAVDPA